MIVGHLVEVNSVFIHARNLLALQRVSRDSRLYRGVAVLNVITFLLFRVPPLLFTTVWGLRHWNEIPTTVFIVGTIMMLVIAVTSAVLLLRFLRQDFPVFRILSAQFYTFLARFKSK